MFASDVAPWRGAGSGTAVLRNVSSGFRFMETTKGEGSIILEGLEFYGSHGHRSEERDLGGHFRVDLSLRLDLSGSRRTDKIEDTVDYQKIYNTVQRIMEKPVSLLEHIAGRILDTIMVEFPRILAAEVCVSKLNPPIGGICRRTAVKLSA